MNETIVVTQGEMRAYQLLSHEYALTTESGWEDLIDAGNKIILLAEQIKAERAVITLQKVANINNSNNGQKTNKKN